MHVWTGLLPGGDGLAGIALCGETLTYNWSNGGRALRSNWVVLPTQGEAVQRYIDRVTCEVCCAALTAKVLDG